jgi:hypothetical protein
VTKSGQAVHALPNAHGRLDANARHRQHYQRNPKPTDHFARCAQASRQLRANRTPHQLTVSRHARATQRGTIGHLAWLDDCPGDSSVTSLQAWSADSSRAALTNFGHGPIHS